MENRKIDLSIVTPIFNEQDNILELYRRLKQALVADFRDFEYEIIFIDDGSQDKSFELLKELRERDRNVKVIQFSRNFGHHIAITAGLDHTKGELVVMMDGDLQDQPEEIISLYNKLKQGYDVVYGERANKKFNFLRKFLSYLFNIIIKKLIDENIVINTTIFRIMTKQVVDSIKQMRERNRYIVGIIGWVGFKHASQRVKHGRRYKGKSKYNYSKQLLLALDALVSFSTRPLKLTIRIGLILVFISFLLALYILYGRFTYGTPILGWTSLILAVIAMGGIQIIILGVIGEYLARIYQESKKRPLYIIRKKLF